MANPVPIVFPLGGISENGPYADQPGRAAVRTDHLLNVRPHDALERRARGGQRTGIKKYVASAVNGSNPIQAISSTVQAFDPNTIVLDTLIASYDFTAQPADGRLTTLDAANWPNDSDTSFTLSLWDGSPPNENQYPVLSVVESFRTLTARSSGSNSRRGSVMFKSLDLGQAYAVVSNCKLFKVSSPNLTAAAILFRLAVGNANYFTAEVLTTSTSGTFAVRLFRYDAGSQTSLFVSANFAIAGGTANYTPTVKLELRVNGNYAQVYVNDVLRVTGDIGSNYNGQTGLGLGTVYEAIYPYYTGAYHDWNVYTGTQPASLRTTRLVVVSGGSIYTGNSSGLNLANSGSGAVNTAGIVGVQDAFQKVYFCDGVANHYKVMDLATTNVSTWTPAAGSLPVGSVDTTKACKIIALYRGRIVLAGLQEDPHNWFMSKAGNPLDWNYSPATPSATQAVAGNNSNAGLVGDIITATIPFQDDLLFFGGDHTLWVMRGDPAAGGQIDNISRQIGVVGPYAWAWDTSNNLHFLGQNGLYRLPAGGVQPELLSRGKLDRFFANINFADRVVRLLYDREWQGVHIFLTPQNQPASPVDHIFWDERTNSFWRDQYPVAIGPTAAHLFDADDPNDRAVLIGGFDSYIRNFSDTATNDDGSAIDSYVRFAILHPGLPMGQFELSDMQINTDAGGNPVTMEIFRGHTPEAAAASSMSVFSKTLVAGRNKPIRRKIRANALQIRLRNNTLNQTWAFESGSVVIEGVGRQRVATQDGV